MAPITGMVAKAKVMATLPPRAIRKSRKALRNFVQMLVMALTTQYGCSAVRF
jgi:hypothetical protein